jgi:hypothetical protein
VLPLIERLSQAAFFKFYRVGCIDCHVYCANSPENITAAGHLSFCRLTQWGKA